MIDNFKIENFGPIQSLSCQNLGAINVITGVNGTGKTTIIKALYSAMRTIEAHGRGNEPRTSSEILADKLYWTFETDKIGDLVSKGTTHSLRFQMSVGGIPFQYGFGRDTRRSIQNLTNQVHTRDSNSIFLPAKEVLSLHSVILESREQDRTFGFDDTYLDLARALRTLPKKGKNFREFATARNHLKSMLGGKIEYDDFSKRWQFKKGNQKFSIGLTAEGIKKISILDILLGNRYLDTQSIVFIDEPESALHPKAILDFLDIIVTLSKCGIQFFMASHSYFVIKKMFLAALRGSDISIISRTSEAWTTEKLQDGMPDNPIIRESVRLYKEEVELALS